MQNSFISKNNFGVIDIDCDNGLMGIPPLSRPRKTFVVPTRLIASLQTHDEARRGCRDGAGRGGLRCSSDTSAAGGSQSSSNTSASSCETSTSNYKLLK